MTRLLLCLLLCTASASWAAFEDQGVGARAPGMGNAFTAVADDVYAIHYNPAGLAQLTRPELGASYSQLFKGLTDNSNLGLTFIGYAHPLKNPRWGTVAGSWEQFSLNGSYYQEHTFTASYARLLLQDFGPGKLYGGVSGKVLYRSLSPYTESANAQNGLFATGLSDPVLSRRLKLLRPDADLGLLYKIRDRYSLGLAVLHAAQPNVAFGAGAKDPVPMAVKLGLNYSSLVSNAGVHYETRQSPAGLQDHIFTLALERWFRFLLIGDFAVRGAYNQGNRSYTNLSFGLSYRTQRFGVDYGFSMPIGAVAASAGSHRMGLSVRFGSAGEPDESVLMVLEAMRQLKMGVVPELKALGMGLTSDQKAVLDEQIALAKSLEAKAKYHDALGHLSQAIAVSPSDTELLKSFGRLNWVAAQIKELSGYRVDPIHGAWHQGVLAYLNFKDDAAIERCSYAFSLNTENKALDGFLSQLELATGIKRPPISQAAAMRYRIEQRLAQAAVAIEEGRYDEAILLSRDVLGEESTNLRAWENLGTSYFAIGDYVNSLRAWNGAYDLETNPARRAALKGYIKSIRNILARRKTAKPAPAAAAEKPSERSPSVLSPQEVQKLYNLGVDHYTAGRLEQAKAAFEEVLDADPAYVPAGKALKRVLEEMTVNPQ